MNAELPYILLMLATVFAASCTQVILKKAAMTAYNHKWQVLLNPRVVTAYTIFLLTTVLAVYCLKFLPLITVCIIESSAYIYILLLDHFFFGERINIRKIAGTVLIVAGILLCLP